jgi:flagellar hook assembly protein FlgD
LVIYNVLGQQMRELVNAHQPSGQYGVRWNGRDELGRNVSSGVYFYRLHAGTNVMMRKMVLMK